MRVLFTSIPGSGHFNPMVPLARAFARRGHRVTFACSPAWTDKVNAAGFENVGCGPAWVESFADPVFQEILRKDFFVELSRMGMVEDVVRAAKAVEADLIVHEGAEIGGRFAGALLGIPVVQAAPAAAKIWREVQRPMIARAAAEHALDPDRLSGDDFEFAYIDRTPPALETPGFEPYANLVNVRPEQYDGGGGGIPAWIDDLPPRPLVYVSFGTVFNGNAGLFRLVAEALSDEPYEVVLATGDDHLATSLGPLAPNIHAAGYLPQAELVTRSAAMVSHAGYNSVISAISAGVPMYAMPMGADQPHNASRLVAAGAALSAEIYDGPPVAGPPPFTPPSPAEVRDAVGRLIADQSFREAARELAAQIAAMAPVEQAVEVVEARMAQQPAGV